MSEKRGLDEANRSPHRRRNRCNMTKSMEDVKSPLFWRGVLAEVLGTAFLVFVGCGSCISWGSDKAPTIVQIALSFGLIVATMVWCIGAVSGGHINPAVTVGFLVTRRISVLRGVLFVVAQCLGAILGSALLMGVTPDRYRGSLGSTQLGHDLGPAQGFGVEFLVTFVLVFTVFASVDGKRTDLAGSAPLTIGLSVAVCNLMAIRYTGASMNPARSFGPAIITGLWANHWVYWCGPLLGGLVAALLYDNVFAMNASLHKTLQYMLAAEYDNNDFDARKDSFIKVDDKEQYDEF